MFDGVTIGQYYPGNSVIHRMDPRVKLVLAFLYIFTVFIPKSWGGLGIAVLFLFCCIFISKIPVLAVLKGLKPILPVIIISGVINMIYMKSGSELFSWKFITITTGGLYTAIFIGVRIACLIMSSSLLMYTTSPTSLTDGIERLLSPLNKIKLNVHELAMMMTIALRFIPTLIEEANKITSAQKARGADVDSGGIIKRMRALIPILVPLFISAFRRAFELATAMECRCYRGGEGRTRMKQMHIKKSDVISILFALAFVSAMIFSGTLGKTFDIFIFNKVIG